MRPFLSSISPHKAERAFLQHLDGALPPTASGGIAAMLEFYEAHRARWCSLELDGDMLLFQWGVYDWGRGEWFELNITRQFTPIWQTMRQLSLTYRFAPTPPLRQMGAANRWCHTPASLAEFAEFVRQSSPYVEYGARTTHNVELINGII